MHGDRSVRRRIGLTLAAGALVALGHGAARAADDATALDAAMAAARAAVRQAFGGDADVTLTGPVLQLAPGAGAIATAVAEPSSRTAGRVRFVLYGAASATGASRVGRLTAAVRVAAPHLRARAAIAARTTLTTDLLQVVREDVGRQPLAPLPALDVASGAKTRVAVPAGAVVSGLLLDVPAAVASGADVVVLARVGTLEVRGRAVAAQSGDLGDTVIVVNPDSRKRLRARVVGDGLVEVLHGS